MRFKIDENLHPEVAEMLNDNGHDAVTVWGEGLGGSEDSRLAETCRREQRGLTTLDSGFGDIRRYPPSSFPGMIVLRLTHQSRRAVRSALEKLLLLLRHEALAGKLWIVEERRVRVRRGSSEEP